MTSPPTSRSVPWPDILLLATLACGSATATELYRWTEADGSITFSPQPPSAGTAYERVGTDAETSLERAPGRSGATGSRPEADTAARATLEPSGRRADPGLADTPPPLGAAVDETFAPLSASTLPAAPHDRDPSAQERAGSSQREERCRELEKRVVSLERRLTTRLSAQDMDDTVLYMARYQQNVERHCRG